jgi:xanthine dehydrogenase YagR molybdenum-binding subunit
VLAVITHLNAPTMNPPPRPSMLNLASLAPGTPQHQHNVVEPHATTAQWDGDRLTVYDGVQNIDWTPRHLAQRFGVPAGGVRVISRFTGGAFGGKTMVWAGTVLTALAARVVQRPVRMMLTREGVYHTVGGRTPTVQRVALGADRDGHLTSLIHASTAQVGRAGGGPEQVTSVSQDMYAAPKMATRQSNVTMDTVPNTVMRAPGEATGTFALESAMDELAEALGMDPIELRMLNEPAAGPLQGKPFRPPPPAGGICRRSRGIRLARPRTPAPSMRDCRQLVRPLPFRFRAVWPRYLPRISRPVFRSRPYSRSPS